MYHLDINTNVDQLSGMLASMMTIMNIFTMTTATNTAATTTTTPIIKQVIRHVL